MLRLPTSVQIHQRAHFVYYQNILATACELFRTKALRYATPWCTLSRLRKLMRNIPVVLEVSYAHLARVQERIFRWMESQPPNHYWFSLYSPYRKDLEAAESCCRLLEQALCSASILRNHLCGQLREMLTVLDKLSGLRLTLSEDNRNVQELLFLPNLPRLFHRTPILTLSTEPFSLTAPIELFMKDRVPVQ